MLTKNFNPFEAGCEQNSVGFSALRVFLCRLLGRGPYSTLEAVLAVLTGPSHD